MADEQTPISFPAPTAPPEGFSQGQPIGAAVTPNTTSVQPDQTMYAQTKDGFASLPGSSFDELMKQDPSAKIIAPPKQGEVIVKLSNGHGATLPAAKLEDLRKQDPGVKVIAHGGPEMNPQEEAEPTGFLKHAGEMSGFEGGVKTIAQSVAHRSFTMHKAYDALTAGDLKKASMLATAAISGLGTKEVDADPAIKALIDIGTEIIRSPYDHVKAAYNANKEALANPTPQTAAAASRETGMAQAPFIGPAIQGAMDAVSKDVSEQNYKGAMGDVAGVLAPFMFGSEAKAADEAAETAGTVEKGAPRKNFLRPSQQNIAGVDVPVPARGAVADAVGQVASKKAAGKFMAEETQPAAVKATQKTFEDVARTHIQKLRDITGDTEELSSDMSDVDKQARAMKDESQKVYEKFDQASDEEAEYHKASEALGKKAAKEADEEFVPKQKPDTFRELQSKRKDALASIRSGDPTAVEAGKKALKTAEDKMDAMAAEHTDLVSPEEYKAANALRRTADKFDYVNDRMNTAIDHGTIDTGGATYPAIKPGALKSMPGQFDNVYGNGAFKKLMNEHPDGMANYNSVRDALINPKTGNQLMQWLMTAGAATAFGGLEGGVVGALGKMGVSKLADNLLFNPEFGQGALKAFQKATGVAVELAKREHGEAGLPGTVGEPFAGPERRAGARSSLMSPQELEEAIKQRQQVRTPFDDTEGANATIARDIDKQIPTPGAAVQRAVNASGESAASQEAINRAASEKAQGIKTYVVDTRSGVRRPLLGIDAADHNPGPYEKVIQVGKDGQETELASGARARRTGVMKQGASALAGRPSFFEQAASEAERPDVPTFYSKAEQVIGEKVPNNASGEQISALLKNNGVKADEMKWAGLDDYLKNKPKVSKAELTDFIRENQLKLEDVDLGKTRRYTTQPNVEETEHTGEKMVDVLDPVNGHVRFTGTPASAQDYMSELGQGLSADEENELKTLISTTQDVDTTKSAQINALRYFGHDSPQYADATAALDKVIEKYTGGEPYDKVNDANNRRIVELGDKKTRGAVDVPTKYDKYTVPGEKSNYNEKLITMPNETSAEFQRLFKESQAADAERNSYLNEGRPVPGDIELKFQDAQRALSRELRAENDKKFTSGHWDQPNVVAHVRYSDRPAVDGKKTLFMEEAQSDWHSAGRHEGYSGSPADIESADMSLRQAQDAKTSMLNKALERINSERSYASEAEMDELRKLKAESDAYYRHVDSAMGVHDDAARARQTERRLRIEQLAAKADMNTHGPLKLNSNSESVSNTIYSRLNPEERAEFEKLNTNVTKASQAKDALKGEVPDAPFKQSWHELVMKRMLRQAAENGYDRLAWTTGEQQAELYDLSKHIGKVEYDPEAGELTAYDPAGKKVIDGETVDPTVKALAPYMGADAAEKLVDRIDSYEPAPNEDSLWESYSQDYGIKEEPVDPEDESGDTHYIVTTPYGEDEGPFKTMSRAENFINDQVRESISSEMEQYSAEKPSVSGLDLQTGGEFHRLLYDTMIPSFLKKYAKKWGAAVGETEIKGMGQPSVEYLGPNLTKKDLEELHFKSGTSWSTQTNNRYNEVIRDMNRGIPLKDAMAAIATDSSHLGVEQLAEKLGGHLKSSPTNQKVHSIEITPAMKKSVMKEGQPIAKNEPAVNPRRVYQGVENQLA